MFKRIALFLAVSLAISITIGVVFSLLGITAGVTAAGINFPHLMAFCLLWGMGGSFISLLISKPLAKWSMGAQVLTGNEDASSRWLVETVRELAYKRGLDMPEVAIYEGEPNAFATGAFKNSALIGVSTGLLSSMDRNQVKAVLAHEISHVANGDMVTLALISGVVNAFVMVIARIAGFFIDRVILRNEGELGMAYFATVFVLDLVIGILASTIVFYFSRQREFRADRGAAELVGATPMISALRTLEQRPTGELPKEMAAFGIAGTGGVMKLFMTHPSIDERIEALRNSTRM